MGAALSGVLNDRFSGAPRRNTILAGAAFGAIGGFLGTAACPSATYVDWAGIAIFGGSFMGVSAAALAVPNFALSLVKGPAQRMNMA